MSIGEMNRIKESRDTMRPPSDETIERLLDAALNWGLTWGNKTCGTLKRRQWAALMWLRVYILAISGLRTSEDCGLMLSDFHLDEEDPYVEIIRAYTRTGIPKRGSQRTIDLGPKAVGNLRKVFTVLGLRPNDFILSGDGKPLHPITLRGTLKEIAKAAGIDTKNIFPQMFRIKFMTKISSLYGPDVASRVAGHSMRRGKGPQIIIEHYWKHGYEAQTEATVEAQDRLTSSLDLNRFPKPPPDPRNLEVSFEA